MNDSLTPTQKNIAPNGTETRQENFFGDLVRFAVIAILIVLPIRLFIAQPFIVSGASMEPTFANGEYLIVDELTYRLAEPERGDVIIFRYPRDPSKFFIKRIVGLPGETIEMDNGGLRIRSGAHPEGLALTEPYTRGAGSAPFTQTLAESEYFVLGDNRNASSDSRVWGPLGRELIIGRAFLRVLPVAEAALFPGAAEPAETP